MSSPTTLKVYFTLPSGKQEIRRFACTEAEVLPALKAFLSSIYSPHFKPHPLRFVLQFDDGEDLCSISSEAELQDGLALHAASGAGGAMKILAAFDTAPAEQNVLSATPAPSVSVASVAASSASAPPSPARDASVSPDDEGVLVESDGEYERIDEDATAAAAAASFKKVSEPEESPKLSAPVTVEDETASSSSPAPVRVSEPTAVEDAAPSQSPEVSIEDVSFSSVPAEVAGASAAPEAAEPKAAAAAAAEEPSIHSGITCDGCGASPILGTRFNCTSCGPANGGYDLCQSCEEAGGAAKHNAAHEFAVHVKPVERRCGRGAASSAAPAQSPVALVQAAVQRVVANLSAAAQEGQLAKGAEALQGAVGDVMSALAQAGQAQRQQRRECRRNWCEARQADAEAAAAAAAEKKKSDAESSAAAGPVVHAGVTCDGCGASPITGVRYHCSTCDGAVRGGFDLCEACEASGTKHDATHLMVKMRVAAADAQPRRGGWGGHHGRGGHHGHHGMGMGGPFGGHHGGWGARHHGHHHGQQAQEGDAAAGAGAGMPDFDLGALLGAFGGHRGGGFWGRGGHGWGGRGGRCHRGGPRDDSVERPRAEFVSDVTLADGLAVHAGETLKKVWSIKNVGSAPWPVGTKLIFVGGDLAPESDGRWGCDAQGALVPYAGPGDIVHVEMDIVVPSESGRFRATFRLQTMDGQRFGPRVWIDLNVPAENAANAAPVAKEAAAAAEAKPEVKAAEAKPEPAAFAAAAFASPAPAAAKAASKAVVPVVAPKPVAAAVPLPVASPVSVPAKAAAAPAAAAAVASKKDEEAALAAEFKAAHISPKPSAAVASAAAPAAAGAGAASVAARVPFAYLNELGYLRSMGFVDNALNKYLLLNNRGDLQAVVQWLLANAKSA